MIIILFAHERVITFLSTISRNFCHSWRRGLKTGMYYLRTKPAAQAIQFTVEKPSLNFFPRNGQEGYGSDYDDGSESHTTSSEIEEIYGPVCDSCSG